MSTDAVIVAARVSPAGARVEQVLEELLELRVVPSSFERIASSRSMTAANVGPPTTVGPGSAASTASTTGTRARDERSGQCARICDSSASSSGGMMAGTAWFAHVDCAPVPFTEKS